MSKIGHSAVHCTVALIVVRHLDGLNRFSGYYVQPTCVIIETLLFTVKYVMEKRVTPLVNFLRIICEKNL